MAKFLPGSTRQLTDLRPKPGKTDPRPHFDLGDDLPPDYPGLGDLPPYRALRWHPVTGEEVCATTLEQLERYDTDGYLSHPIQGAPKSAVQDATDELAALTDEERQMVLAAQRQKRLEVLQTKLAKLSDAELAAVQGQPVKRGPGRPRKTDA